MQRLIIFLIRLKLGVKKYEKFRFTNQKEDSLYFFTDCQLFKKMYLKYGTVTDLSGVSLNWLLSSRCKVRKVRR